MLSGFALLWFLLAVICMLVGLVLTVRREQDTPSTPRLFVRGEKRKPGCSVCSRCAQPLDVGARFCGACGLYVDQEQDERRIQERSGRRSRSPV